MIKIIFEKTEHKKNTYKKIIELSDNIKKVHENIILPEKWHLQEKYLCIKDFYKYSREKIENMGKEIGKILLGETGIDFLNFR